ncbi:DNA-binding protein [Ectopseudomonas mendocina]|uniref:DNA-binding protein n=1 Tax=Ectopseudomonas mendocina TaxID=300 RepID=A0ABD7RS62_ECTME|nr:TIR domain-containing protein [Pseudomonas mendocina]TRO12527.1 DNA-binding protein [Pseudomonas mendocina]TRO14740.1 DNA-binding protein [Pseudomonas mendocina]
MKPRIFIGSSVEGLGVAYAIQQNLTHVAEPTVWDQGVFSLSGTTIESLISALDNSDYGIFVFSPDDITEMRQSKSRTIRDNVLFEFGLFVGRLGRERVFYIIPENIDFHLPSDLLGVTPAKYNPFRDDNSLQAATGPACNQIRQVLKTLPLLRPIQPQTEANDSDRPETTNESDWINDFFEMNYKAARDKLEKIIETISDPEEKEQHRVWILYSHLKESSPLALQQIKQHALQHKDYLKVQIAACRTLKWQHYIDDALEIIDRTLLEHPDNIDLITAKAECLKNQGQSDAAIATLCSLPFDETPQIAIALAEHYEEEGDIEKANQHLHISFMKNPSIESISYKYAKALQDLERHKEAAYIFDRLTRDHPQNSTYWGYLSNSCLRLNLYDLAMTYCKKAIELSEHQESWLFHNIGNMFNHKGFYNEAIEWLNKGLAIDSSSEYGHLRFAEALQSKTKERKTYDSAIKEGRLLLVNIVPQRLPAIINGTSE